MRQHAVVLLIWAGSGCYAHQRPPEAPKNQPRPALIRPTQGRYAITRGGEEVGEERFAITSSSARWSVAGDIHMTWPVDQAQGYELTIDERSCEPISFSMWIEIVGERQEVKGVREGDHFNVHAQTIGGEHARQVPYAAGTVIDFGSPMFNTLALSLLGPTLELGQPVPVRTILISLPRLDATVLVEMYELRGRKDGLDLVAVHPLGALRPTAMWVRPDGLPVRVRSWVDEGEPFELVLDGGDINTPYNSPSATETSSTTVQVDH